MKKKRNYWNRELCLEIALTCKTKTEFSTLYRGAYTAARINGWLEECSHHMTIVGSFTKRLVYSYEFEDKYVYVGLTFNSSIRFKQHSERNNHHDPVYNHIQRSGLKPIIKIWSDYIEASKAKVLEATIQKKYLEEGWQPLFQAKPGGLGGNIRKWTKEEAYRQSRSYTGRREMYEKMPGLYRAIHLNKWLDFLPPNKKSVKKT